MKEAMFYRRIKGNTVQCVLCPHYCTIKPGERGRCRVRENRDGKLMSLVYARPCAVAVDPIEKKPLYHFLPGTKTFSIGTAGCNFSCLNCQNAWMSQSKPEGIPSRDMSPEEVVRFALSNGCRSISYTYSEPTVFYEYAYDTAKLARKKGLKNVFVTNGYINQEPLKKLLGVMDAFSVDLKGIEDSFYRKVCGGRVRPVLDMLKAAKKRHVEVVVLVIPGFNDSPAKIKKLCVWVKRNLGDVPMHFSRYFPCYKMKAKPTTVEALVKAKNIASKAGLSKVHVGNV